MIIPARGDLVWLNFNPQAEHEQAGRRPAIVLSESTFNEVTGFAMVCPITSSAKGYAFEVPLPEGLVFTGVVLTDQLMSLDVRNRRIEIAGNIPVDSEVLRDVLRNVRSILA
ncbi:type II toxin-antitoxin system PemK/MazF family toxin [Paenibacillus sp. FA6]|uniref:type II toxin-antitoxin system PemK/MazF family toxin n=1 Tax=Paenibacillus sp. FA6 TaxID=3413029 RepID=UPI003F65B4A4